MTQPTPGLTNLRKTLSPAAISTLISIHIEAYLRGQRDTMHNLANPYPADSEDAQAWLLGAEDEQWRQDTDPSPGWP